MISTRMRKNETLGGIDMWTRKELKTKSKVRFRANRWKSVLTALILMFAIGSLGTGFNLLGKFTIDDDSTVAFSVNDDGTVEQESEESLQYHTTEGKNKIVMEGETIGEVTIDDALAVSVVIIVLLVVVIIACIIVIPLQILVFNPLEIGCKRFFVKNLKEDAQIREICYAFDNGYKNNVKIMFFRELHTALWFLLLVIPGIIKAYEYQMIPYILAENPGISKAEAFALSKKMMQGNKWKSFVLDLSFLGWELLDIITLGILGVFYLSPYEAQTEAALYEAVKNQ